ncbi:hypothetical protein RND81_13G161300 [Saponaria officinalis]|uniref:Uncharacterized protein n=1 Tax=Saponaria officinalis TaxID=3572 RepID=A0AAW1H376_SAPOF
MCHTSDYNHPYFHHHHHNHRSRLKFSKFTVTLSLSTATASSSHLPETLTLVFLPRINAAFLHINGSTLRPDSPFFLTLHRISSLSSDVAYSSDDRVSFSDGVVFEVHLGEIRLIKGVFREDDALRWRVECKCAVDERGLQCVKLKHVEVRVGEENGRVLMREKVVVEKKRITKKGFKLGLVEIPEEREDDVEEGDDYVEERDDDVDTDVEEDETLEGEMEVVRWAVDVGIWATCLGLGLGLLASRASIRSLKRRKLVFLYHYLR